MLGRMTWKRLAGLGGLLLAGGATLLVAGACVLTNNARHADISPAVYWGLGIGLLGLVLLLVAGLGAWMKRS
jgi:membrane-bound ClpP family serine protease